ncbi:MULTISPECIES: DUF6317 family protein [Actinomycetes]|uniref:Uncharacterized protein n=2 Tax=Actinomycetes TaxID=1760 RepID=A0ABN3KQY1_9ACTN|nr:MULTISPECIES: DUF6317 family protein [Streptomyces]MYR00041.1 hypothetical protein [Streptomyces sp. SID6139]MYR19061.1 hypothetical protein [Streptomyces sp. SID6137]MYR85771.1 hypothetical protein [Streptomyces sp. SID685]TGZ13685.1 hypothetical protein DV517_51680 [Streptomyces sp. S816]WDO05234.1 DUF6317 family protein [Streptomyces murinus]
MTADFKVIYDDLSTLAKTFHDQAGDYRKLAPDVSPAIVSGGDPALDSAIKEVADLIIALHTGLADRMDDHSDKAAYARDSFHRHDIDIHGLFDDLTPEDWS